MIELCHHEVVQLFLFITKRTLGVFAVARAAVSSPAPCSTRSPMTPLLVESHTAPSAASQMCNAHAGRNVIGHLYKVSSLLLRRSSLGEHQTQLHLFVPRFYGLRTRPHIKAQQGGEGQITIKRNENVHTVGSKRFSTRKKYILQRKKRKRQLVFSLTPLQETTEQCRLREERHCNPRPSP